MYCSAKSCLHKDKHNILGHRCSKCKSFGHSVDHCYTIRYVYTIVPIPEEKKCSVENCRHKDKHTTEGHYCRLCRKYGHGLYDCPSRTLEEYLKIKQGNVFYVKYDGMWCYLFYTRTSKGILRELPFAGNAPREYISELFKSLEGFTPLRTSDRDFVNRMKESYYSS